MGKNLKTNLIFTVLPVSNKYSRSIISESGKVFPSFKVLSCQNLSCGITMNGTINIHHLLYNHLNDLDRPTWLKRSSKSTISTIDNNRSSTSSSTMIVKNSNIEKVFLKCTFFYCLKLSIMLSKI